jgi:hypothetical protein
MLGSKMKYLVLSILFLGCATLSDDKAIDYSVKQKIVDDILRSSTPNLVQCYNDYRADNSQTEFSFKATIVIDNDGVIQTVSIDKNIQDKLDNCLKYSLYKLEFPKNTIRNKGDVTITQPFNIRPY